MSEQHAPRDPELKKRIAREVFDAIRYGVPSNATVIPGVLSVDIINQDDLVLYIRARVDHGGARGQKYHFYTVKVAETQ